MKKIVVMLMVAALAVAAVTGCGAGNGNGGGTASGSADKTAEAQSEAVEETKEDASEAAEEAKEDVSEAASEAKEEASEVVEESKEDSAEADDEENYDTGDASKDDPGNKDDIGEKELMVVSFGTSYNDSRRLTIGAIEKALAEANPDWAVRRAFTSQIIIDHIKKRDNVTIDNVKEALERAEKNGVKELVVQPTHLMDGYEYNDLMDLLASYAEAFESVKVGNPLLTSDEDFSKVAEAVYDATKSYDDGKTAIVFMGHGTEADSNKVYAKMQTVFEDKGYKNHYMGTVEASPSVEDVIKAIEGKGYERVVLRPLMVVAGDHANNDMAGDEDDSWKTLFEKAGYKVETIVEGLGQLEAVQQMYVDHAGQAMNEK
ncbi:MAG: sirohydrochlorin cobaltochelatase [Lachnospiraceae bacterium]|nr:sirohydrochlorin cobaltochelatase [Lachnospiraceae bacterium]